MVHTIAPVVYRHGRSAWSARWRWFPAAVLHVIGALGGGLALGIFLGLVGTIVPLGPVRSAWAPALLGGAATVYALHELRVLRLPYPQWKRQVPAKWRSHFHPYVTALLFGVQLGTGYATFVSVSTLYILTAAVVLSGSAAYGALLFGSFAIARAGLVMPLTWSVHTHAQGLRVVNTMIATKALIHLINGGALALTGGYLLGAVAS